MDPLLRDECIMLLVPQITWRLNEAAAGLVKDPSIAVVYRRRLEECVTPRVLQLGLSKTLLTFILKSLHQGFLLISQHSATLVLELFHAFIGSPRPFEVS